MAAPASPAVAHAAELEDWEKLLYAEHPVAAKLQPTAGGPGAAAAYTPAPSPQNLAHVRTDGDVSAAEKAHRQAFLGARPARLAKFGVNISPEIKIGISLSGGGMRAFYEALGFLCGLEEIGLLGCCDFTAALSGSSWMLFTFLASDCKTFQEFALLAMRPLTKRLHVDRIWTDLYQKRFQLGVIDLVASLLQQLLMGQLLGKTDSIVSISALQAPAELPYPIATFIELKVTDDKAELNAPDYTLKSTWFEVTPTEVACAPRGGSPAAIPVGAFASQFDDQGVQKARPPPQDDLAYLLAITGSAYAAPLSELVESAPAWLRPMLDKLRDRNPSKAVINPTIGDFRLPHKHADFHPRDGGIAYNVPIEPLLRRGCNVILMMDSSAENAGVPPQVRSGAELNKARQWYNTWKAPTDPQFPDTPEGLSEGVKESKVHMKHNDGLNLLYVPRFSDQDTFEFVYDHDKLQQTIRAPWLAVRKYRNEIMQFLSQCKPVQDTKPKPAAA